MIFIYTVRLSIIKSIIHIFIIFLLVISILLYPPYSNTKKKIIGTYYTLDNTEVIYIFSQEINKLNKVYYKNNIKILYKNKILIKFLKDLIHDYNKEDVLSSLLNYNLYQHVNYYKGKMLVIHQFKTLNEIMLNNKKNNFTEKDLILMIDFILDSYITACRYRSLFTEDEFKVLKLPIRYFMKKLKEKNKKLHNEVINTYMLQCFYI
jgi:hypothetical protein